jgi:RNA polymerase sigma-70 factor (ECF subfamily)
MALAMTARPAPATGELDGHTLARARAGDPDALRAFVVRYERAVFALLSRIVGIGPQVEDLAQETFLRALRALPSFEPDGAARVSTWLLTIATRIALDARKRRAVAVVPLNETLSADHATPEAETVRHELGRAISRAAAELDDDQRAAFVLAELHGFTMAEIARALSIPESTAKTRLHRARRHMRERLAPLRLAEASATPGDDDEPR